MRLCFILPELKTLTRLNPARGSADIDDDELDGPKSQEVSDVIFGERSDPCSGLESVLSPQFSEGKLRYDRERGVHFGNGLDSNANNSTVEWPFPSLVKNRIHPQRCCWPMAKGQRKLDCENSDTDEKEGSAKPCSDPSPRSIMA